MQTREFIQAVRQTPCRARKSRWLREENCLSPEGDCSEPLHSSLGNRLSLENTPSKLLHGGSCCQGDVGTEGSRAMGFPQQGGNCGADVNGGEADDAFLTVLYGSPITYLPLHNPRHNLVITADGGDLNLRLLDPGALPKASRAGSVALTPPRAEPVASLLRDAPRPVARSSPRPLPECPGRQRPGASCPLCPAVGTPAPVAAATDPLTRIAEQGARGAQGRSHVWAE
ncbi:hypothetical protein AAY473_016613 [Plecturocebus cupreus]